MRPFSDKEKGIMEACKEQAQKAGLVFGDQTLEYVVTNRDLLELSPKVMIPNLYDYWVHDVEVLKEKGKYELYPGNPYETVINTRPAISFYNDNNPDWLNAMICYHVVAHIDFFQNNLYFRHTWDDDFNGQALSDKRLFAKLRSEKGEDNRWVDYVIEFIRGIDNLVGYHDQLSGFDRSNRPDANFSDKFNYYFDVFLQDIKKLSNTKYIKEIERYNETKKIDGKTTDEELFFYDVTVKYPEFEALFKKFKEEKGKENERMDPVQFLMKNSPIMKKEKNNWMKKVMEVVRKTSLFFQPQIRTKIINEGWASYWHQELFTQDPIMGGHEVEYARVDSGVTSLSRVGLNPYAIGLLLIRHAKELGDKGKYSLDFQKLTDAKARKKYDRKEGNGKDLIFSVRENFCDFTFIKTFLDQDFMDKHNLFVAGKRLNKSKMVWEYYVKSRKLKDYLQMIMDSLYHPPYITISNEEGDGALYLFHHFEDKPLVQEFIKNTMIGISYLWGDDVMLETSEVESITEEGVKWKRVVYIYEHENKEFSKHPA